MSTHYTLSSLKKKSPSHSWLNCFILINKISLRSSILQKSYWFGTLIFAVCLLILFPFGLGSEAIHKEDIRIGIIWIINEFISILVISRMFAPEQEANALEFILSARNSRFAILSGKIFFITIHMLTLQIPMTIFWIILYNVDYEQLTKLFPNFLIISLIFNFGTASLGALISSITARSLGKEIIQPLLFFPLHSGILLAAVTLSLQSCNYEVLGAFNSLAWWTILCLYPVIFTTLGFLLSNILLQD